MPGGAAEFMAAGRRLLPVEMPVDVDRPVRHLQQRDVRQQQRRIASGAHADSRAIDVEAAIDGVDVVIPEHEPLGARRFAPPLLVVHEGIPVNADCRPGR